MSLTTRGHWLAALLPALLGAATALILRREGIPDPLLELRGSFSAGSLALSVGVLVTLAWLEGLLIWHIAQHRLDRAVSARHRMAAEARQRFIRRLDHELKNPLTATYAALENLAEAPDEVTRKQALQDVTGQLKRAEALIRALRKLTDLEIRSIERLEVDVAELLMDAIEGIASTGTGDSRCRLSLAHLGPWLVEGDRDLLWMVFFNLVDNALKFTDAGDPVTIRVDAADGWLRVSVSDPGRGIAPHDLPHVFEELYRGDNAAGIEGSGIGLALARTGVQKHGGRISVSCVMGSGTTFTVLLPRPARPRG